MSDTVIIRNAITDMQQTIDVQPGTTVHQAVSNAGFIAAGNDFSVRDKDGNVVDHQQVSDFSGRVLSVGLSGEGIDGGGI